MKKTKGNFQSQFRINKNIHPFGTTSYRSGSSETEVSLKRNKYVGKERDEETGLYYYGARYYAGWIGRFVSVDPLQFDYAHLNPYNYAANKPVTYMDVDGFQTDNEPKTNPVYEGVNLSGLINGSTNISPSTNKSTINDNVNNKSNDTHTVVKGDILWDIAQKSNGKYSVQDLLDWNPVIDPKQLQIGAEINLSDKNLLTYQWNEPSTTSLGDLSHAYETYDSPESENSYVANSGGGVDAMDVANYVVSNSGTLAGGAQYGVNSMSNKQQWKYSYKAHKYLKGKGVNVQTRAIKHGANGVLKNASRKITYVGGVLAVADVAIDGELRASHLLNAGMVGVSAIPVAGWIIGGGYFVADMITLGVSGQSIGQHLDAAVGAPLVNDIYDW